MSTEFDGQVALVTGVTGGIGHATAQLMAQRGARVILGGRNAEQLLALQREIGAEAIAVFDLGDRGSIQRALAEVVQRSGSIDILANVAGVFPARMVEGLDDDFTAQLLDINLQGAIRLSQAAAAVMQARGAGAIVHVSSLASEKPLQGLSVYAASKAGLEAFSRVLAQEVAPAVRVNVVAPGPTRTATALELLGADDTGAGSAATRDIPLGRLGEPREVAEAIAFMASPRASFITGAVLRVNGGAHMA